MCGGMGTAAGKVGGTFAVLTVENESLSEPFIISSINSCTGVDGRGDFECALRDGMIELDPARQGLGAKLYRPTAKGALLIKGYRKDQ